MKSALLVVLLAAVASAAVVSHDVPDVADGDEVADLNVHEMPEVIVTDVDDLTDAAELTDEAEETAVASRRSLNEGTIGSRDVLIYDQQISAIGVRDVNISTGLGLITAIRVNPYGPSNDASPTLRGGGVGNSFAVIRLTPPPGLGFSYTIQVYAR